MDVVIKLTAFLFALTAVAGAVLTVVGNRWGWRSTPPPEVPLDKLWEWATSDDATNLQTFKDRKQWVENWVDEDRKAVERHWKEAAISGNSIKRLADDIKLAAAVCGSGLALFYFLTV